MDKSEVKHLVKQELNRDPPLENYLKEKKIYGNYVSELTKKIFFHPYISSMLERQENCEGLCLSMIRDYINRTYPLEDFSINIVLHSVRKSTMRDIDNN